MKLKSGIVMGLYLLLSACHAYRTSPDSEILFTQYDLTKRGFTLAPVTDISPKSSSTTADLNAYDTIFANTLRHQWPDAVLISTSDMMQGLEGDELEKWRDQLAREDSKTAQRASSPASLELRERLKSHLQALPDQVLSATVLQNSVSCGHKEALPTYLSPDPKGQKPYCQRLLKMRFRILDVEKEDSFGTG